MAMRLSSAMVLVAVCLTGCGPAAAGEGSSAPGATGGGTPPATGAPPSQPVPDPVPGVAAGVHATPVLPRPGPGRYAVSPVRVRAAAGDGSASADVYWWSGVEPCYTLRPVKVTRHGTTIILRLYEGSDAGATACIELAMFKTTRVELGALDPGTYTVAAGDVHTRLVVG